MKEMSYRIVRSLGIGRNLGWVSLDARGSAGGVLVMWDKRVLEGLEAEMGSFSISCRFRNCEERFVWVFSGLYGPIKGKERRELWDELVAVKGLWSDPWCIAGDFNVVRFPVETSNGRQMSTTMREFSGFIEEFELVDPPLGGGAFTWSGGEEGSLKARLDRFLFLGDWEERVSRAMRFLLLRPVSDHWPILLDYGGMRTSKSPFRLGSLSEEDRSSQRIARDEFSHCAILEEISWRQKSRALWLKEGDSNTKFFHRMANARRRGNFIGSLTVTGVRLNKEEKFKEGIGSYFKSLFE
ncbi:hypothetical protein CK203_047882 [Vitis vinifera]|uniref:Endonuclease/exonuclease/phosphatase domain-containing protein n=1 Tax=Vitis vinifera TaxID=29760 RepID=A0A438GR73_VITVI|nr:hypothetical protein CK203_047882 [Vitis vinifera]